MIRSLLFALFLSITAPCAESNAVIEAVSFNIRYGTAKDGENHWDKRKEFVAETVRDLDPDLLGTQECLDFQAEFLERVLPGYSRFGKGRQPGGGGERCEIFWKTGRFAVADKGTFMLSPTPDEHASRGWDAALPRIATWIILKDLNHKKRELFFLNTHFDHRGRKAREESAALVRKQADAMAGERPIIVMGDMNFGPGAPGYKSFSAAPWVDTYRAIVPVPVFGEGTFSGFKGMRWRSRIDYIFTRDFRIHAATIDRRERDGRNPSDHFPVTATLEWKE